MMEDRVPGSSLSYMGTDHLMGAPSSWLNPLPQVPIPNTTTPWTRFQHMNFVFLLGGRVCTHTGSITDISWEVKVSPLLLSLALPCSNVRSPLTYLHGPGASCSRVAIWILSQECTIWHSQGSGGGVLTKAGQWFPWRLPCSLHFPSGKWSRCPIARSYCPAS